MSAKPATLTAAELDAQPAGAIVWCGPEHRKCGVKRGRAGTWRECDKSGRYRPGFASYTSAQLTQYGPRL